MFPFYTPWKHQKFGIISLKYVEEIIKIYQQINQMGVIKSFFFEQNMYSLLQKGRFSYCSGFNDLTP